MKRLTALALALIMILPLFCGCADSKKLDAVIIIPGIMGSELFLAEDVTHNGKSYQAGTKLWVSLASLDEVLSVSENVGMLDPELNLPVSADEPIVNYYYPSQKYGTLNNYSALYHALYDEFGKECDVVLFNYDWRNDPYDTAAELDDFINNQGYRRVSIVAHSMGGLVASHYFARGKAQRKKVHTFISLGTPYLGAEQATYVMITGNINSFVANLIISEKAREIAPKLDSMYALLPYEYMWRNTLSVYTLVDKSTAGSYENEKKLLAKYVANYSGDTHSLAEEKKSLLFDKKGKHVSALVNSYYIVGDGEKTIVALNIPNDASLASKMSQTTKEKTGDGVVSLYSATAGETLPHDRIFIKTAGKGSLSTHESLADGSDQTTIKFIISVLRGEADKISSSDLNKYYSIKKGTDVFKSK